MQQINHYYMAENEFSDLQRRILRNISYTNTIIIRNKIKTYY